MKRPLRRLDMVCAAKINVGWRVGARREDAYHDVCGLMQTISVHDRLEITTSDAQGEGVTLSVPGHPALESDDNLVHAAARALGATDTVPATTVVVHKTIPVGAGLGGGSADAAAALVGLNTAWGLKKTPRELARLAAAIGSDVPAILMGGLVHASGRGESVRSAGSFDSGAVVLGVSHRQISAKDAYETFDRLEQPPDRSALHHNDLEAAACALFPDLTDRLDAMRDAAGVAFVSGSGPTVVGVCADEAYARGVAARIRDAFDDVVVARPIAWGVRLTLRT